MGNCGSGRPVTCPSLHVNVGPGLEPRSFHTLTCVLAPNTVFSRRKQKGSIWQLTHSFKKWSSALEEPFPPFNTTLSALVTEPSLGSLRDPLSFCTGPFGLNRACLFKGLRGLLTGNVCQGREQPEEGNSKYSLVLVSGLCALIPCLSRTESRGAADYLVCFWCPLDTTVLSMWLIRGAC